MRPQEHIIGTTAAMFGFSEGEAFDHVGEGGLLAPTRQQLLESIQITDGTFPTHDQDLLLTLSEGVVKKF